jgi:hypothetical protein
MKYANGIFFGCFLNFAFPAFASTFIINYGHYELTALPWVIDISADKVVVAHVTVEDIRLAGSSPTTGKSPAGRITTMVAPNWNPHSGWFLFVENSNKVWVYNGAGDLLFDKMTAKGRLMAEFEGSFDTLPEIPPVEVINRLPPNMQKALITKFSSKH